MTAALWSDFDDNEIGRGAVAPVLSISGDLPSSDPANAYLADDCREDARLDVDERLVCEHCGEYCDRLTTVDDIDRSVGYHGEVQVCDDCLPPNWRQL